MNNDSLERLDLLSDLLQVLNTYLLLRDATNNQLMQELQHQNTEYFEKIIGNQTGFSIYITNYGGQL